MTKAFCGGMQQTMSRGAEQSMDSKMVGQATAVRPSLDRLKALGTLPNLQAQVDEARQLCTHSARADMVLKWLVEKLKKSDEARTSEACWRLLDTALRLLPPERIATLLGSADFLAVVQSSVECYQAPNAQLLAVSDVMTLLLELASGEKGALLKAQLRIEAARAAGLVAALFKRVTGVLSASAFDSVSETEAQRLARDPPLGPAIQIWSLRKPRANENEFFAKKCLVPATHLLRQLGPEDGLSSSKRKRGDAVCDAVSGYRRAIESMLAKHVFLPARTAFFEGVDRAGGSVREKNSAFGNLDLADLLAPLKEARPGPNDVSEATTEAHYDGIPFLLDVALRSVPAVTPRQRLKERPWIETVFAELLDCVPPGTSEQHDTLRGMLTVLGRHASLSKDTLAALAKEHAAFGNGTPEHNLDWQLIAKIVELDANVYVDADMATALFGAISGANVALEQGRTLSVAEFNGNADENGACGVWKDEIIIPIMQAFARNRNLLTFVELWHKQLQRNLDSVERFVWDEVDQAFAALVETSLTEQQVTDLVSQLHGDVKGAPKGESSSRQTNAGDEKAAASVVVLHGVFAGIRTSELLDSLHAEIQNVMEDVMAPFDDKAAADRFAEVPHTWMLLRKAFEVWFPSWAARRNDRDTVLKRIGEILHTKAVSTAKKVAERGPEGTAAFEAGRFLGVITNIAHSYGQAIPDLVESAPQAYVKHPALMQALESVQRWKLIAGYMDDAAENIADGGENAKRLDGIWTIVDNAIAYSQVGVIEDVVHVAVYRLVPLTAGPLKPTQTLSSLNVLGGLPPTILPLVQREKIVDRLCELVNILLAEHEIAILGRCIAVLVQVLEMPCPAARLCTNGSLLWSIAAAMPEAETDEHLKTVELLEQLAGTLMRRCKTARARDDGGSWLFDLSKEANRYVEGRKKKKPFGDDLGTLVVLKTLLSHTSNDHRDELTDRSLKLENVEKYATSLLREAKEAVARRSGGGMLDDMRLLAVLDALLHMPQYITEATSNLAYAVSLTEVVRVITKERFASYIQGETVTITQAERIVLVRCVQLIGSRNLEFDDELVVRLAVRLLGEDSKLQPREHAALLDAFHSGYVQGHFSKIRMLNCLFLGEQDVAAPAQLLLLRTTISTLTQEDFETTGRHDGLGTPQAILHKLLEVAVDSNDAATYRRACDCVTTVVREKPFMTNQYIVEATLSSLQGLLSSRFKGRIIYLDACRILTVLLQQYRSRLKDRLNLVVAVFQALIAGLFARDNRSSPAMHGKPLTARHARIAARIIQLLCNPPQLRSKRSKTSELVDEARKAQAHVGQYVQYVLHHYCAQVLSGTLAEGVREALMPGLWAMIEAIEVNSADGIKSLSAAMNNSERAVLRGVYEEYKSFGKWQGG